MIDHRRLKLYSAGQVFKAIGSAIIAVVVFLAQVDRASIPSNWPVLLTIFDWTKHSQFILLAGGFIFQCLGALITRHGQPIVLRAIQELLDSVHSKAFPNATTSPENFCRVTLFRRRTWSFRGAWEAKSQFLNRKHKGSYKWPWSGWMVPYMRSGQLKGRSTAAFYAPKDNCHLAEGMAGQAWTQAGAKSVANLQELHLDSSLKQMARYCKVTYTPRYLIEKYIKSGRPLPRCMTAYQVCTNDGEPWGSIVIDSREPEAVNERAA